MNSYRDIFAGLFGGATSAILLLAANMGGSLSSLLAILVTFPIYVVTLSWGTRAGLAAVIAAFIMLALATTFNDAVSFTLLYFSIAAVLGHQANLAQAHSQDPNDLFWFPISRLLANLTWMVVIAVVIVGYLNNFSPARLEEDISKLLPEIFALSNSPMQLTPDEIAVVAKFYANLMPFVSAVSLMLTHVFNLNLSAYIARRSGLLKRPQDDIPATLNQPMLVVVGMALGLMGPIFFGGLVAPALTVLAGACVTALALVGLASLHFQLRGRPAAPLVLLLVYAACIILFLLPFYLFSIVGVVRVFSRQQFDDDGNQPNSPNSNQS